MTADIWEKNIIENLERKLLNQEAVGEFLANLKEKFREKNDKIIKITELKKIEQENRMMEEFV